MKAAGVELALLSSSSATPAVDNGGFRPYFISARTTSGFAANVAP
jgi:phosphoglycolate phosphatase-like HAD superfamily hydrolase